MKLKSIIFLTIIALSFVGCSERIIYRHELISLNNNNSISGSFFLGCGSIGGTEYIYGWMKDCNGVIKRLQVPSNMCEIYMDENSSPYVVRIGYTVFDVRDPVFRLHVPANTIIQKYELK